MECKTCGKPISDFSELIRHIIENKNTHPRWQVRWAGEKSMNADYLNQKVSRQEQFKQFQQRVELTDQEKQNKADAHREISGITKTTLCYCINCHQKIPQKIEVEHIQNPFAWRKDKLLVVSCLNCRK